MKILYWLIYGLNKLVLFSAFVYISLKITSCSNNKYSSASNTFWDIVIYIVIVNIISYFLVKIIECLKKQIEENKENSFWSSSAGQRVRAEEILMNMRRQEREEIEEMANRVTREEEKKQQQLFNYIQTSSNTNYSTRQNGEERIENIIDKYNKTLKNHILTDEEAIDVIRTCIKSDPKKTDTNIISILKQAEQDKINFYKSKRKKKR